MNEDNVLTLGELRRFVWSLGNLIPDSTPVVVEIYQGADEVDTGHWQTLRCGGIDMCPPTHDAPTGVIVIEVSD